MISIHNLNKSYQKTPVLKNIFLEIPSGCICGLFGVNGAGKSTLLKILCGLETPNSGDILFNGKPFIAGKLPRIGAMIESPAFFPGMSAFNNLKLLAGLGDNCPIENVTRALKVVGLFEKKDVCVRKYSLGMKQRLYFASAILRDEDILILDEPFNGIDPITLSTFEKLIKSAADKGKTILISSHEIRELQTLVQKAVFLDHGSIVFDQDNVSHIDIFKEFLARVSPSGEAQ